MPKLPRDVWHMLSGSRVARVQGSPARRREMSARAVSLLTLLGLCVSWRAFATTGLSRVAGQTVGPVPVYESGASAAKTEEQDGPAPHIASAEPAFVYALAHARRQARRS